MTSVLIIACGAIAKEIVALQTLNEWQHVDLQCLPAHLHNTPNKLPGAMREKLENKRDDYDKIFVAYGDCGTGGLLDEVLNDFDVERLPGAHCYDFFAGQQKISTLQEEEVGTYFLTDFLVRNFERLVIKGLRLDKYPQLMGQYFGHYQRVVYLAQQKDTELEKQAQHCAEQLQLDYHYCFTGFQPFAEKLAAGIEEKMVWQND